MIIDTENIPKYTQQFKILNWNKIKLIKSQNVLHESKEEIENVAFSMLKTCINNNGIGLAGPQVGIYKNIIICQLDNNLSGSKKYYKLYINPDYKPILDKEKTIESESCLSVPGRSYKIKRWNSINLSYQEYVDENLIVKNQTCSGFFARLLQHEIDHLRGISIPQRWKLQNKK